MPERGIALIVSLMAVLLLSGLGLALVLTTSTEAMVAANFRNGQEALYAADAALERVLSDLLAVPDWNPILAGWGTSAFVDGPSGGPRLLPDGTRIDLTEATNLLNCGRLSNCSVAEMNAVTEERPWGADNPRWRLYAHGPMRDVLPAAPIDSPFYVMVWTADDPAENDSDPTRDGSTAANPGTGVLALRAEAFGPAGSRRAIEATVANQAYMGDTEELEIDDDPDEIGHPAMQVLSWREVR